MTDRHFRISTLLLLGATACAPIGPEPPGPEPEVLEAVLPVETPIPSEPATAVPSFEMNAPVAGVHATRDPIILAVGESVAPEALVLTAVDAQGTAVPDAVFSVAFPRGNAASLSGDGTLTALREGEAALVVTVPAPGVGGLPDTRVFSIPVVVRGGAVRSLQVAAPRYTVYTGTAVPFAVEARTAGGDLRERIDVGWSSRNPEIASVSRTGLVRGLRAGSATIVASAEGRETAHVVQVLANPVRSIELTPDNATVRTGDVVRFDAVPRAAGGRAVRDVVLTYSVGGEEARSDLGAAVHSDGSFVAETPGRYRVVASAGPVAADAVIEVRERDVARRPTSLGVFADVPATGEGRELAVFRGRDGRDYAYVGADSRVRVWDVTVPESPFVVDSIALSGTATDIEVSEDASFAVLSQGGAEGEGGLVVLDLADPAHPVVVSAHPTAFVGGVRDASLSGNLVYAIPFETPEVTIFDLTNRAYPVEVGGWSTERPGRSLSEIRVSEGLAYLAAGADGVWILDVGDGRWGGVPAVPTVVSTLAYPDGHAETTFPYRNSDGRAYLFVGDRISGCRSCDPAALVGAAASRGFVRILSIEDPASPIEVARYEVPEAGVRGLSVVGDELHAAYEQAGLRVVDVSGELSGDLYRQGREIAWLSTGHPAGTPANTPRAAAVYALGSSIFVSDEGSGIWVVRLAAPPRRTEAGGG